MNNNIEIRELETGYQLEILVNDYTDSKMLNGKNGKFIENIPKPVWEEAINKSNSIQLLIDHCPYVDVADSITLEARDNGVYAVATLTNKAKGLYKSIKETGANGISFGFKSLSDSWNGIKRTINSMELKEVSILMTKNPAYKNTMVECRDIENRDILIPYSNIDIKRKRLHLYSYMD
ncbi:MAG: HK97 family phage prohead protease [Sarcina sp.]